MFTDIFSNTQAVSNFGFMTVIAGLFIYIFYAQYKMMMKNFNKFFDNLMENQNMLLQKNENNSITSLKSMRQEAEKIHMNNLSLRMEITPKINLALKEICLKHKGQRCYIMEFHNTNSNFMGVPFAKYSVTFEHLTIGLRPIMAYHSNIGFSALGDVVPNILNKGYDVISNNEDFQEKCPLIKGMTNMSKAKSMIMMGLFDGMNKFFGILVVEYGEDLDSLIENKKEFKKQLDDLKNDAISIATLLNLTPYQK